MAETVLGVGDSDLRNYACKDCKVPMGGVTPTRSGYRFQCSCCHIVLFVDTKTKPPTLTWRTAAAPG